MSNSKFECVHIYLPILEFTCSDIKFGIGRVNDKAIRQCEGDTVGIQQAQCNATGGWIQFFNNCTLRVIQELADKAKVLLLCSFHN